MDLEQLGARVGTLARKVGPAVVAVGRGSGTVVGPDRVLTNAHNVAEGPLRVRFADGRVAEGTLAAADLDGDLAVVGVDTGGAVAPGWATTAPTTGTAVLAAAATRVGGPRVTVGLVSADGQAFRGPRGGRIHGAVEHTAPMGRGSSGGPLLDLDGRLLGVNTHRRGDGLYLALPTSPELRARVDELVSGRAPRPVRLGIAVAPSHVARRLRAAVGLDERDGLLVREVDADGPAGRAGVGVGDLVVAVDAHPVATPEELVEALRDTGEEVSLGVVRGSQELDLVVVLAAAGEEGSG